ncbi:MAG: hypothetical protein A2Y16_05930 [Tenericutes bacterium GWF2_57_13]|nr:MAG: hypothetical protein A2Y16_05930 [Tenericutes bacterium GWF2_57_13]
MRQIFLPDGWTVLLCFLLWPLMQVLISWMCLKIPDHCYHPEGFWFRTHKWEQGGEFYHRVFRVRKWKERLPDGGRTFKDGYRKKRLTERTEKNLQKFLLESCRAELSHGLAILPFWVFGFFAPAIIIPIMFVYAVMINGPCIIAQRFNRPRIQRMLERIRVPKPQIPD